MLFGAPILVIALAAAAWGATPQSQNRQVLCLCCWDWRALSADIGIVAPNALAVAWLPRDHKLR
jgi:hypothetical protein